MRWLRPVCLRARGDGPGTGAAPRSSRGSSCVRSPRAGVRRLLRVPGAVFAGLRRWPAARGSSPPRRGSAASLRAVAGVVLLLIFAVAAVPAQAQVDLVTLVKNIDETPTTNLFLSGGVSKLAQKFTTGSNRYTITSARLTIYARSGLEVSISTESGGNPSSTVFTFTNPERIANGRRNTFTVPASESAAATLAANTDYFVVFAHTSGNRGDYAWQLTGSEAQSGVDDNDDDTADWSIANNLMGLGSNWGSASNDVGLFELRGVPPIRDPRLQSNNPVEVLASGTRIALRFDRTLDTANPPPASAFEVEVDGDRFPVDRVAVDGSVVNLDVLATIRQGQTVEVGYTDPTSGDDAGAIQDTYGTDAADFTRTATNSSATIELYGTWLDCPTTEVSEGEEVTVHLRHNVPGGTISGSRNFRTSPGTATAPGDYVARDFDVFIGPRQSYPFTVSTTADTLKEASETFTIRYSPTDTVRDRNNPRIDEKCEITILDDDTANAAATGEPVISGTPRSGQTLTADTSRIADANGLHTVSYEYGWFWVDGNVNTRVGTNSRTYTVMPADVGKRIKVVVAFTDSASFAETVSSDPVFVRHVDTPATGAPVIAGSGLVGKTLTAGTSDIADVDGLANVEYRYHWIRVDGTTETIVGADEATYVPVGADVGRQIKVRVSFVDDAGGVSGLTSAPVTISRAAPPAVCPALPDLAGTDRVRLWSGTVTVGDVLLLDGRLLYGHGFTEGSLTLGAAGGLSDKEFGIGGRAYTVRTGLVGGGALQLQLQLDRGLTDAEVATLALHVCGEIYAFSEASYSELVPQGSIATYSWGGTGLDWSGETTRTLHLSKTNTPATGAPGISGTHRVGETLRASTGTVDDIDGLTSPGYRYRWIRVDGSTETAIAGAASSTYTLADADEGKRVKVEVAFTDDLGFAETRSASVAVRAAGVQATCEASALGADETEIWTGEVTVGTVRFQGAPIAYGFAEALSPLPAAGALSDTDFETGYSSDAHTVRAGMASAGGSLVFGLDRRLTQVGTDRVVLHVCGEAYAFGDASYDSATRRYTWSGAGLDWSSVASRTLRLRRPSDITPPEIVIARTIGEGGGLIVLQFREGLDHDNRPSASVFTVTADGRPLTVTVSSAESGGRLIYLDVSPRLREGQTVTLTYTDPTPGDDARAVQDAAGNDAASFTAAVRNDSTYTGSGNPEITGTARVGETLTASPGNIDDAHGVTTAVYGYQWIRQNGGEADIPGAAAETYTLTDVDEGKRIRVRASFVDDAGNAETRTSERTGTVAVSATAPKITIAPDRAKATGRFDFIRYTVAREGPATDALTVTVRLEAPAGNDWEIDDDKRSHEVAFRAGEAEKTLLISLRRVGPANVGFSHGAAQGGTLLARLDGTTGYDTADTAEVEVVVVPNPLWIARLTEPAYTFIEDGTTYEVEIEVAAASPDMPAPSMPPDGNNPVEVYIATSSDTAFADVDYEAFGRSLPIPLSSFMAGPDGVQRGRAVFRFAALQDSEPEGAETLWFFLERAPIVALGAITFEGPDGRRDTNSVRYPATIVEANTPASGAPAIAGTGRAGETLRATTDAVSDVDGLGEFTYRWVRVDGSVETEIGTGAATYLPVADDVGKRIRVEVAFADALGFAEGPLASDSVAIRAAAPPAVCPVLDLAGTGRSALAPIRVGVGAIQVFKVPVAYGYYTGDAVLSAAGTIGGGSFALGGTAYAVEGAWAGTGGSLVFNLDGAVSAAERAALALHVCGESYAFADAEHDPSTDAYTWQHAGLDWSSVTSRTLRLSTTRSLPTGAPEIEGTARMGETLEAATDAIADADGLSAPGFAYQWIRVEGVEETEISGADARTYTVTAEDLGKAVRVRVRFTDDRSFAEEATSAALPIVNTPATGAPEIRGSGRVGGTMRAATGGIVEPDGLGNAVFSYRWVRLDGAEETEVGTDSDSYGVVAADEGKRIRVEVTFTDDLGAAEGPLASIPATVLDASPPLSSSCGTPALAGRVQIWSSRVTLSTSLSGGIGFHHEQSGRRLQDPDFVIASAPAYTFLSALNFVGGSRNGGLRFELDRALAPSHAASLVLHDCDDSFAFADAAYSASDLTYSWPAAGADWRGLPLMRELRLSVPGNNPATGAPGIAGTARVGETLTALTDGIGDVDGRSGASFVYRWLRVEGETATAISGATAGTYTLAADDEGNRVKVEVAFTDDLGSPEGPLESAPFPAAGTVAPVPASMTGPSDLLSATLTVKEKSPNLGCFATGSGVLCSSSSVMTDNDFTVGTVDYFITQIYLQTDGSVLLEFGETVRRDVTGSWTLTLGTTELVFNDAARNGGEYTWTGTGLSWTADDTVAVKVTDRGTGDTTPPAHAGPSRVTSGGDRLVLVFSEALDHGTLPATDRYTVEADGSPIAVVAVDDPLSENERLGLALASPVYRGQTVRVRYADPSDADDARAVQDAAGNDAASFTSAVRNDSDHTGAPGEPTGLEATAIGPTRIDLAWRAPVERGDSDITGYRIEFSPDGVSDWRDLMEDTGERAAAYSDTRVVPAETRHYRVSAINGQGPGAPSEPADATTVSALPKIAGQPRVGATLRVETGDIGDLDGVDPATFAYRWIRIDGPVETEIRTATGETYELVEADAGKRVRVKVSFTDLADGGGNPEERASEAFPARGTVLLNTPATGRPAIAGTGRVGGMLTAETDAIADADGLSNAEFRYRWVRLDGPEIPDATATGETYAAVADDLGKRIRVEVEFTDDHGSPEGPLASGPVTIRAMSAPASCPRPGLADRRWIWSGTVTVGPVESSTSGVVRTVGHGFAAAGGALSDRDFELGANGYTVSQGFAATGGELRFYLDRALAAADSAGLVLHVCGETYAFADAALYDDGDGFEYSWPGAGLDWSPLAGMTRTLVLSVADPGAPGAPAGLTARAVGSTRIDLAWDEPLERGDTAITGYRIEWSADGRSGWRDLVANTGSTDRAHADTVAPETTRHYRVSAINAQGPGSPSVAAHAATGTGEPGAPRELVAAKSATNQAFEIDLAWEEPADRGDSDITSYRIEWSADGTSNWRALAADTGSTDRTWSDVDLPSPTTRHYRVSAINAVGPGQASNTASATTDDVVPPVLRSADVRTPGLTVFLLFADAINSATLPMASAFTVSADGYRVDVGYVDVIPVAGGISIRLRYISPTIKRGQSVVVTYTDPNPGSDDATGVIQDRAGHDAASFTTGEDGVPAAVNDSGAAPVAPDAPTGLMAEAAGDTGIVLTWSPPAYNGGSAVTGYLIEVSPDGTDGSFTTREANHDVREDGGEDGAIVTAYTHTGLTRATTRHYRVSAINAAGTGAASASTEFTSATTTMVAPGAPTGLTATAHDAMPGDTSTQIDLAWTAPAAIEGVAPPTGYRIEWSPDGASDWEELVEDTGTTDVVYSDAGLPSETTRHYRVSARNAPGAAGLGPPSNVDGATSEDIEPPTGRRTPVVFINGIQMAISYDLSLDITGANAPLVSAFTVTADGIPITVGAVVSYSIQITGLGRVHRILLDSLSPTIKRGQTVTVTYTDPTPGDDARAIQDVHGNDAASFTLTARNGSRLDDPTLPGAPTGLAATANDAMQGDASTQIDLAWTAPAAIEGVPAPTGYRIEWSPDGTSDWEELVEDTSTTDVAYSDAGLPPETTRHYRVFAINASGTGPPSNVDDATTEDFEPPTEPRTPLVHFDGVYISIRYDQPLDATDATEPLPSAFTVIADGIPITIGDVTVEVLVIGLGALSPTIKRGQVVTVTYTDPTDGDDARAIQDVHGNDAASYTVQADNDSDVDPILPGAPTGLTATANDAVQGDTSTQIDLAWVAPGEIGSGIKGYLIEVSPDGTEDSFTTLEASHDTMEDGEIVTAYADTGLPSETTRYYRVKAISAAGTTSATDVAHDTTADIVAPVLSYVAVVFDTMRIQFNEALDGAPGHTPPKSAFTVTADGFPTDFDTVSVSGPAAVLQGFSPTIKAGQTVTVTYTDANAGDDTAAIQDLAGNDAAGFTTGEDGVPAVVLGGPLDPPVAPDAPAGLTATAAGETRIDLVWSPPPYNGGSAVTGYLIEVSADGSDGSFTTLEANHDAREDGAIVTAYAHTGDLAPGTTRHYRVFAINAAGTSPASGVADDTTATAGAGTPDEPTELTATATGAMRGDTDTNIDLDWTKPAVIGNSPITGYLIERSADGVSGWLALVENHAEMQGGEIVTGYSDTGLPSETVRHYRVSAINDQGTGPASVVAHTASARIVPLAPTGLAATTPHATEEERTVRGIALAWRAPADTGTTDIGGYRIEWSADGMSGWQDLVEDTGSADAAHRDRGPGGTGFPAGTTRHYRVSAINDGGVGRASDAAHATIRSAPVRAGTNARGSQIAIEFGQALDGDAANAPAADRFAVSVKGAAVKIGDVVVAGPSGQVLLNGLSPLIRHGQVVTVSYTDLTAGDDATGVIQLPSGLDAGSFEVEVHNYSTAQPSAPEKPAGLDAEAEDDAIALRWEPPVHDGGRAVTGYRIEVSADGTRFTTLEESHNETKEDGEIETAYMDAGLGPRTTRHYRVRATNEVDTGPASETAMATTAAGVPGAPTGLAATANDAMPGDASTQIDLAWTKPAAIADVAAPTGYRIEVSPDGASHWRDLVPNHAEIEMQSGEIVTAYADVDLPSETTRHYRVSAINGEGRGPVSGVEHATSADIAAPAPVSASVAAAGTSLAIVFDEALDEEAASEPAPERFAVTAADGAAVTIVTIGSVAVSGTEVSLSLDADSPVIRAGQTVTVAYTDPTAGDDAAAVQDDDGNDAETFEGFAVVNGSGVAASVPGAPTGLGAEARGPDRIRLSWDTPADNGGRAVTGYRIDVSTDGVHFATLEAEHDVTVYEHMGVPTGVTRHYLVYAINAIGTGEASVGASAMTTTRVPGAPTGLAATANDDAMPGDTSTHIDLAWTKPAEIGESAITGYKIEWSADGNAPWIEREANHAEMENGGIVTAYSDTGLDSETTRYYRISAINGDGAGSPSNVDGATTGDIAGPEPQSASVTGSGTGIAIVFDEALDGDPANAPATDRFAVSVDGVPAAVGSVVVWSALKQVVLGGFSPAIRDGQAVTVTYTDLTDGDDATGVIQDDDGNDAEPFTLPRTLPREILVTNGATRPVSEPDAPESLMAESGQDRILLTWDPPADYGGSPITGYLVERSADVDPRVWRKLASNHEETAYEDVVEPEATRDKNTDVTRHYRVSATNAIGTGDPSDPVRGTIETGLADAPAGLTATAVGGTRIDLAWKEPADEGESLVTGYRIEWSEDGNAPWEALVEDTGSTDRSHSDTMELDSETTRHYRVAAINGQGTGPRSEPAHATTDDIVMPMPVSASVAASGAALTIVFDEALDAVAARLPAAARFAVAATDGACIGVGGVTVSGTDVTLALSLAGGVPAIKRGQTVTVGYTDPSAGDDAAAVQDDDGNDAATFAGLAVANGSDVDPTAPARPTGLVAEAGGDTRIGLAWRAPCNTGGRAITGYRIERSADDGNGNSDGNWEELEDDGSTDVAYSDTGRGRGTRYHYRVSARNAPGAAGLGPVSDVADTATTMTGPGAPTELGATAIGTTIRLSWMKPADEGATAIRGYKIERSADDGSGNSDGNWEVLEDDTGTTATTYDDEGLGHGETYHYRVSAFNSDSAGPVSNVADATIDIRGPVPQSASVAAAGTTLTIAFDEALDAAAANLPAAARFAIAAPDGARFAIGAVSVSGTHATLALASGSAVIRTGQAVTVAYTDPNGGDDTAGVVQDAVGNDAEDFTLGPGLSVTVNNGSTVAPTVATRPTGLVAMAAGDTRIDLSWNAPADNGGRAITGYRIERSTDGGLTYPATPLVANHDAKEDGAIVRAYRDTDVMPGTTRHYRVSAINMIGAGPVSDAEHATTSNCAPGAPTGLGLTAVAAALGATSTQIDLSWTAPTDLGTPPSTIRGYRIERSADGNAPWTVLVADTEDTATSHSDEGLASETTRHYRVSAMVSGCDSAGPPSDAESATSADIVAPAPVSASVAAAGTTLTIVFDEALDAAAARLPAAARFEISAPDGAEIAIGTVSVSGTDVTLALTSGSAVIRTGQAVTVAYSDLERRTTTRRAWSRTTTATTRRRSRSGRA